MKKFIIKIIVFLLFMLEISMPLDRIITKGARALRCGEHGVWHDIFNSNINTEVIIQGSSRALVCVDSQTLEDNLGLDVYNLGIDGYRFPMQHVRYRQYRKKNLKPKVIIQVLDIYSFTQREGLYNYEQFLPYFNNADLIEVLSTYEGYSLLDSLLPLYRYRAKRKFLFKAISEYFSFRHYPEDRYQGFWPQDKKWDKAFDKFKSKNPKGWQQSFDSKIIKDFEDFIISSRKEGIVMAWVYAPEYIEAQKLCRNREEILDIYNRLSKKYDIVFIDYSKHELSKNKSMFYNSQHLNKTGAEIFSKLLSEDIKKIK